MSVRVIPHVLGTGLRGMEPLLLKTPPSVGDWLLINDDADGTIAEVVKVLHICSHPKADVDVIVELIGPFEAVKGSLESVSCKEDLDAISMKFRKNY